MKKVFIIMMMALMSLGAQAQTFYGKVDETDLLGSWEVTSISGSYPYTSYYVPLGFKFGYDGSCQKVISPNESLTFRAFFISNGDKLHIIDCYWNMICEAYIVKEFDTETMVLNSLDKICTIELKKTSTSIYSARMNSEKNKDGDKYTIQGLKTEDPEGIYIQNGKKFIAK